MKEIRSWKKALISDYSHLVIEMKELVTRPAIVILEGEMGAGKTTFVQSFASSDSFQSPTYSIIHQEQDLVHADFYRLESSDEIDDLGLENYQEQSDLFFIEWGDAHRSRLYELFGEDYHYFHLSFEVESEDLRNLILSEYQIEELL